MRANVAMTCAEGNGGTRACSFASSSAMSGGSRARRVDSILPNLAKIGPRASSARRRRPARGNDRGGREGTAVTNGRGARRQLGRLRGQASQLFATREQARFVAGIARDAFA